MQEISKEILATRDSLIKRLNEAKEVISFREKAVNEHIDELNEALQTYNNILKEADKMATGVVQELTDYIGSKSEGWKEEKGDAYDDWHGAWTNIDLEPVNLVDEVSTDDMGHPDELFNLPLQPEC